MQSLPSGLNLAVFIAVASAISFAVAGFSSVIGKIPGMRPSDSTRSVLMRSLVFALNLLAIIAYAYLSNIVIPKGAVLPLLMAVAGQTTGGHFQYLAMSNARQSQSNPSNQGASSVAVDPSAAIAELAAATQQATAASA